MADLSYLTNVIFHAAILLWHENAVHQSFDDSSSGVPSLTVEQ
jgi:hypothetical protein